MNSMMWCLKQRVCVDERRTSRIIVAFTKEIVFESNLYIGPGTPSVYEILESSGGSNVFRKKFFHRHHFLATSTPMRTPNIFKIMTFFRIRYALKGTYQYQFGCSNSKDDVL